MLTRAYLNQKRAKLLYIGIMLVLLLVLIVVSVIVGSYKIPLNEFLKSLFFQGSTNSELVIWHMRLPQTITSALVGAGLALCGAVLQVVLKNPLASPFTLGISSSSAFGAALAIFFGSAYFNSPYMVSLSAFLFSLIATFIIVMLSRLRNVSNETMILAGVATG
jgi:iron complex transport system permease protein